MITRFKERHDQDVTMAEVERMAAQIQHGVALPLRGNYYAVKHGNRYYQVAYDESTSMVVTVLP